MELTFPQAVEVEKALNQATGYAYARQDAAGEKDTEGARYFALAYQQHVADYLTERRGSQTNLAAAWQTWTATNGGSVAES